MDWFKFVKRYVWNETKTPYLIRADKLTRTQARNELYVYTVFLATLFIIAALVALSDTKLRGSLLSLAMTIYAVSVFCSAILLGATRHVYAAIYCLGAPIATFLIIIASGLRPELALIDKAVLLVVTVAWLRYAVRVVGIVRAFPNLADDAG